MSGTFSALCPPRPPTGRRSRRSRRWSAKRSVVERGVIKDGAPLPANVQWPNGVLNIYFHEAELVALLDTARNERPVHVRFNTDLKWGSVGTDREPVGEEEEPAGP